MHGDSIVGLKLKKIEIRIEEVVLLIENFKKSKVLGSAPDDGD
jgi:hypothetical protein